MRTPLTISSIVDEVNTNISLREWLGSFRRPGNVREPPSPKEKMRGP
ncbi:hypothetical protein [Glaciihabitans tibetensis]|nr:hypothetical protein [Glaciihabitans tibetensis]